jgi:hypothetical protein
MKKVISPDGRRPKTPGEKLQDVRNAEQAARDLHQLKEHYGSYANITREWNVPKSTLEGIYKGRKKVVGAATLAFIKAALQLVWLQGRNERLEVLQLDHLHQGDRVAQLVEENERLRLKIDKLLVPEG